MTHDLEKSPSSPESENSPPITRKSLFSDEPAQAGTSHWNSIGEDDLQSYKRWSILAIVACLVGILSLSGFLYRECFLISLLGILLSLIAYILIIRSQNTLTGTKVALLGLGLSVFSCVGVATTWSYYQYTVRKEADRFFRLWFDEVKSNNIRLVMEMKKPTWSRSVENSNEDWWKSHLDVQGPMRGDMIGEFMNSLNNPCMRTLMALGNEAEISYYKTTSVYYYDSQDKVSTIYAVTMMNPDNKNERQTFFIQMRATRSKNQKNPKQLGWSLNDLPAFQLPDEFSQEKQPAKDDSTG